LTRPQKEKKDRYASCEEFKEALLDSFSTRLDGDIDEELEYELINGNNNNMRIITVGREIGNDIVISDDSFVGRHHLQLIKDEAGVFFVRDLNSTNGTFVNGQRIKGESKIEETDIIRIGNTTLPWISYFVESGETEVEEEAPKKNRRRRKKTQEEKKARKEKIKKMFSKLWRWIFSIISSIIMMLIFWKIMELFRK